MLEQILNAMKKTAQISLLLSLTLPFPLLGCKKESPPPTKSIPTKRYSAESKVQEAKKEDIKESLGRTMEHSRDDSDLYKLLPPLNDKKIISEITGSPKFKELYLKQLEGAFLQGLVPYQNTYHFINIHLNRNFPLSVVEEVFGQPNPLPDDFTRVYRGPLNGSISKLYLINPETSRGGAPIGWMLELGLRSLEIKDEAGKATTKRYRLKKFIDLEGRAMSPWYLGVDAFGKVIIRYSGVSDEETAILDLPQYSYLSDTEKSFLDVLKVGKADISKIKRGYKINQNLDLTKQIGWLVEIDRVEDMVRYARLDEKGKLIRVEDTVLPMFLQFPPYFHGVMP